MNILIIENSETLAQLIEKSLRTYGYTPTIDDSNFDSEPYVRDQLFDIIVINTGMSDDRSLEILNIIKNISPKTKILGLCNKGDWSEKVKFLKRGADDVLTYPFPMQELLARIQSLLRRPKNYLDDNLCIGNFELDMENKCVYRNGEELDLRKKEYQLFEYLMRNQNRIVSRCELLDHVWDYRKYTGSNTVDVHIKRLRDKLDDPTLIRTIHGVGYQVGNDRTKAS
jgi:DNA-binding response OmpR family regulator